jgi:putative ATPase
MIILASEDIGIADPIALTIAISTQQAVHFVGFPEGAIPLAEAAVYLATAPKSNSSYNALKKATKDAQAQFYPVPLHLRNANSRLSRELGYGKDYKYPHNEPNHFIKKSNLPDSLQNQQYYYPSNEGYEKKISERIRQWWGIRPS